MLPTGIGALLLLLVFVPGWAYLSWVERVRPAVDRSGLSELLEVVAMGVATTGPAVLLLVLVPNEWLPFTLDLERWAGGKDHPRDDFRGAALSVALIFGFAMCIAYGLYRLQTRGRSKEFHPEAGVGAQAIGQRPRGKVPWVGVQLTDGRLVEGLLHSFSLDDAGDERDIALSRPIRVTGSGQTAPTELPEVDRFVVPAREIKHVAVVEAPEAGPPGR
jgi:hypothetical protein